MKSRLGNGVIAMMAFGLFFLPVRTNADDEKSDAPDKVAAPATTVAVTAAAPPSPAPAATNAAPVQAFQFPKLSLPPLLDQVVKLSQSGTDEKVIRSYIDKAAPAYRITGNEIVQLRDLGISQDVIMALIDHSQSAAAASTTEVIAPQMAEQQPPAQPQTNTVYAPDAAPEFYDSLAPYGSWAEVPDYGWCWQPSVAVVSSAWQPYCDGGYWLWSDYGWYWHSYYSWGWAPFHYGRWFCHGNRGWLWCPDNVWGSSWVCWRNSGTHCGWAPLPPGACFTAGHGWTHHGKGVGINHDFGISASHFTFVAHDRFTDRHVGGQALRGQDAAAAFHNSQVVNNYALGANNRMVNHGIARETVAAAARTPLREVAVRELPRGNNVGMPDRVNRVGNSDVVFRPGAQISVPRNTGITANQPGRAAVASRNTSPINPAFAQRIPSRVSTANASLPRPNYSQSYVTRSGSAQPIQRSATTMTPRASAAPQFQARTFARPGTPAYARPSAPATSMPRSFTPSASAPRSSAPSGGGRSYSGGGASGASRGASTVARSSGGRR